MPVRCVPYVCLVGRLELQEPVIHEVVLGHGGSLACHGRKQRHGSPRVGFGKAVDLNE